ncbi:hypothetical protein [Acidimangrovimonas pyrenivorans]|uniref:Uncharacterized protein n=1 Tax=Acidimangrovimonas pyrenivorans TaxID=2030798 RepID=A0ABV7ABU1_9RHOB
MSAITVQQMADRVAELMDSRLQVRGKGLAAKLQNGGRNLPRDVRANAEFLVEAATMAKNPKLLPQIDEVRVAEAYNSCLRHLTAISRHDRRKALARSIGANIAFSLLVVFALLITVLVWRGFL